MQAMLLAQAQADATHKDIIKMIQSLVNEDDLF